MMAGGAVFLIEILTDIGFRRFAMEWVGKNKEYRCTIIVNLFHLKISLLSHPHPDPPFERGGRKRDPLLQGEDKGEGGLIFEKNNGVRRNSPPH
jgi:hypothetical protein